MGYGYFKVHRPLPPCQEKLSHDAFLSHNSLREGKGPLQSSQLPGGLPGPQFAYPENLHTVS